MSFFHGVFLLIMIVALAVMWMPRRRALSVRDVALAGAVILAALVGAVLTGRDL